jgi:4-hydroxybenzoate polyprenyltransferase
VGPLTTVRRRVAGTPPGDEPVSRPPRGPLLAALVAMRPGEWIKNLLVYAGLLFAGPSRVDEVSATLEVTLVFIAFCAISSAGYLFNDLRDAELDRRHPTKRYRPIAAGELGRGVAATMGLALAAAGLGLGVAVEPEVGGLVAAYGALTAAYTALLKHVVIVDVMTIAGLFLLRVVAGAVAIELQASEYLLLCTAMLALFLGFTKRRQEAISEEHAATDSRPVLEHYSLPFLDQMVAMVTAAAIMSYSIYAINSPNIGSKMLATGPPVLYAIFRYLYLIYDRRDVRSTAEILTEDAGMIAAAIVWVGTALALLYVFP